MMNKKRLQKGSTLIEVMVASLILGIGLLGVISLQVKGTNSGQRAGFGTEAQILAQDMADRIMAYGFGSVGNNAGDYAGTNTDSAPTAIDCSAGCTAAEAVTFDQAAWAALMADSALPRGRGEVVFAGNLYTIRVMWDQERTGGSVTCQNHNCYQMELRLP